jgi:hypothetical protein
MTEAARSKTLDEKLEDLPDGLNVESIDGLPARRSLDVIRRS